MSWASERNAKSLVRLNKALPAIFPAPVMVHALARPLVPPTPRLAIESYWRTHPLRADRLARSLIRESGAPAGWIWRPGADKPGPAGMRAPPAPYKEAAFSRGPGHCCVCGLPVYRLGWHRDLWGEGRPNKNAAWHSACVAAWKLWQAPTEQLRALKRLQNHRCAATGKRLLRNAEVDHRVPLHRVRRDHADLPWPDLIAFWGMPNLQVINRAAHVAKCTEEAGARAKARRAHVSHGADENLRSASSATP